MAAVNVTITGVICDLYGRTITGPVKIVGEAVRSDVGVGGGPIVPPPSGGGDGDHIWGPTDPRPTPPIANVPGLPPTTDPPQVPPPSIWPPGPGIDFPSHPIVIPPPITDPPQIPAGPVDWKPVWTPDQGWMVIGIPNVPHPAPSRQAQPQQPAPKK